MPLWLWKTNKQLASRPSMKERTYFSCCLQVLAVSGDTPTDALVSLVRLSSRLVEVRICVVAACLSSKILKLLCCFLQSLQLPLTFITNVLREAIFCHYGDIQQVCNPTWKNLVDCCLAKQTNSRTTSYWSSTKTTQERIHVERRSFTIICMYVALHYPHRFVNYVIVAPPILRLRKNSYARVIQS